MFVGAPSRGPSSLPELLPPDLAARLDGLDVISRKVLAGKLQGERRSKRRGRSVEFDDYREYVPGDDLRHIDWNVFARLDRFVLKVFQEEEDLALDVLVDASASMLAGSPSKRLLAARLAMALAYLGLINNNRVSVGVIGSGRAGASTGPGDDADGAPSPPLVRLAPVRGRRHAASVASFLIEHALNSGPAGPDRRDPQAGFTDALRTYARAAAGKGIVVVLSDLLIPPLGGYGPGLAALAARAAGGGGLGGAGGPRGGGVGGGGGGGLDAYVLQVLTPEEVDPVKATQPDAPGQAAAARALAGDLRLTDAETGRAAEVTITPELLRRYRRAARAFIADAATFCRARGLHHRLILSDQDPASIVLESLRRQGLVG